DSRQRRRAGPAPGRAAPSVVAPVVVGGDAPCVRLALQREGPRLFAGRADRDLVVHGRVVAGDLDGRVPRTEGRGVGRVARRPDAHVPAITPQRDEERPLEGDGGGG